MGKASSMDNEKTIRFIGLRMSPPVWGNFRFEFAAALINILFLIVSSQYYIPLAIQHGASNVEVGIMTAAGPIGLLFAPYWASIVERGKPKPYLILSNLAARLMILFPAFYPEPWMFVLAIIGVNILLGIQAPAYASLLTRGYPAQLRGRIMGYVRMASGIFMIPAVYWIGGWIDRSGGSAPLIYASITGFAAMLMYLGFKETIDVQTEHNTQPRAKLKSQLKLMTGSRTLGIFFIVTSLAGFGNMLGIPLYQIIQVNQLQLTNLELSYIRMAYYALLLIGYLAAGIVVDRFSPRRAMLWALGFYVTVPLFYAVSGNYYAAIGSSAALGIADAFWDIGCLSYVFRIAPGREAVVFGLHLMLVGIRGTVAPLLSTGLVHSLSYQSIFFAGACLILSAMLLLAYKGEKQLNASLTG